MLAKQKNEISDFMDKQMISDVENAITVGSLEKDLTTVKASDTVERVLEVFKENYLHAAPVLDDEKQSKTGTPFAGVINIVDLLTAFAFQPVFLHFNTETKVKELNEEALATVLASQKEVLKAPISQFMGISSESKRLWVFDEKDSLGKLLDTLCVGVHRVLISHNTRDKDWWTFLTQLDILRFLKMQSYRRDSAIGDIFLKRLTDLKLGLPQQKFVTLPTTASALAGFRLMLLQDELTALPVVDETGKLVNTLSASDFRGIHLDNMKDTLLPVNTFLARHRGKGYKSITARPDETLSSVVDKLLLTGVHRVWVLDKDNQPVTAVSLTDVIKNFSTYAPEIEGPRT